ncbi:MAG: hydrogenase formation protein HypD [Eubacteriales bacterium]|nr:hydrogenase formation protein HypD [Eubacteriales bacterium]
MLSEPRFRSPDDVPRLLARLRELSARTGPVRLMEICGTHTMAIARSGLKSLLPPEIRLLSGPGCPVCVTPTGAIDAVLALTEDPRIVIASYGDLLRVPGSKRGDSLLYRKALGASVEMVYSPMDALKLARTRPEKEVVFLGVGFETTAPGTAACLLEARAEGLSNFSVLCLLKRTKPALQALIESPDFAVDALLCPGHVAAVTGAAAFDFLPSRYGLPAVIGGFEPADLFYSVLTLCEMLAQKKPACLNEYLRVVRDCGNPAAMAAIDRVFFPSDSLWRGLSLVKQGGYAIRPAFAKWDAASKFGLTDFADIEPAGCRCAQVIRGVASPPECPLFGGRCTPSDPVGPCMVSSEGACAAAYRYRPSEASANPEKKQEEI